MIRRMEGYEEGQKIWVEQQDGSQRAAIFVGEAAQDTARKWKPSAWSRATTRPIDSPP
jgi:hypothetical protein